MVEDITILVLFHQFIFILVRLLQARRLYWTMIRLVVCIATIAALIPIVFSGDACKFTDGTKGTIDISSLSGKDGQAKFSDIYPSGASNWSTCP